MLARCLAPDWWKPSFGRSSAALQALNLLPVRTQQKDAEIAERRRELSELKQLIRSLTTQKDGGVR